MRNWILVGLLALILVPAVGLGVSYARYRSLEVYEWSGGVGGNVIKDDIVYEPSPELGRRVVSGELVPDQVIGRFKGDPLIGPKFMVLRLRGVDERDGFMVRGLMFEVEYARKK